MSAEDAFVDGKLRLTVFLKAIEKIPERPARFGRRASPYLSSCIPSGLACDAYGHNNHVPEQTPVSNGTIIPPLEQVNNDQQGSIGFRATQTLTEHHDAPASTPDSQQEAADSSWEHNAQFDEPALAGDGPPDRSSEATGSASHATEARFVEDSAQVPEGTLGRNIEQGQTTPPHLINQLQPATEGMSGMVEPYPTRKRGTASQSECLSLTPCADGFIDSELTIRPDCPQFSRKAQKTCTTKKVKRTSRTRGILQRGILELRSGPLPSPPRSFYYSSAEPGLYLDTMHTTGSAGLATPPIPCNAYADMTPEQMSFHAPLTLSSMERRSNRESNVKSDRVPAHRLLDADMSQDDYPDEETENSGTRDLMARKCIPNAINRLGPQKDDPIWEALLPTQPSVF
ncbi:hypothetical protein M011DRAFT_470638 [Sporormia fimetaria CBS 119925]|uniref:Uncharacterized protein n=1 Tax=Sporormia fimetaria CBS 119925 TaxID=1340428 RepID=A0A6A6V3A5_9PLEO|nr:hypothetical protein M011DRAFT_470638 [Sporormia fimetaria CBS 119925]